MSVAVLDQQDDMSNILVSILVGLQVCKIQRIVATIIFHGLIQSYE